MGATLKGGAEASPAAPAIGPIRRFGRYTLVKKLATGGMAEIWLARQRGLAGFNRFVVIKKILSHLSEQETFVKMFLDEARTSAQLNHPNIVQIYDLGLESESYYIAMEFIAGENLAAIAWRGMKRGRPLSPAFAARIIADTCKALHYAHHMKGADGTPLDIVHRDISPQNILVTYEGEIKVVDFGIAKAATKSEHTKTGMLKGKFSYMSPEQCLGTPVDMRSDIFALGILLYELCTGKRLFKHESELMILEMITKRSVVLPSQVAPGISSRLEEVIMTALDKSIDGRFQTAQDMQIALEDYLREEETSATNGDISAYMRALFEDKIEEKRVLREAASRDDFEAAFGDEEPTEGAAAARGPANRRRVVHGLPPSQVRVLPAPVQAGGGPIRSVAGAQIPAQFAQGTLPQSPMLVPGKTPSGFAQAGYASAGQGGPGATYPGGPNVSFTGPAVNGGAQAEGSGIVAKLVIGGALLVIIVASTILYQQLVRTEPYTPPVTVPPVPVKTGKLFLDSLPPGAAIYLDDKPMTLDNGEQARTPSDLTSLQYGTPYKIRLVKDAHDPFDQTIVMGASTDGSAVRPHLKAHPGKLVATVAGTLNPAQAREVRIFFASVEVGAGPEVMRELDAHESVPVTAKMNGMTCVADPARARIAPGSIVRTTIRCEQQKAVAKQDERPRTLSPKGGGRSQPKGGDNTVAAAGRMKGGEGDGAFGGRGKGGAETEGASGPAGCRTNPSLPAGFITIGTTPVADIYIGDRKIGQTPIAKYKVAAGCIEVRAVTADGKSTTKRLAVEPNKVNIHKFDLK